MKIVCVFDEHGIGQTEQAELTISSLSEFLVEQVYRNRRTRNYSYVYEYESNLKLNLIGEIEYEYDKFGSVESIKFLPVDEHNYLQVVPDFSGKKIVMKYNSKGQQLLWEDKT